MSNLTNPGNHNQKSLVECNDKSPLEESRNIDPVTPECPPHNPEPNQTDISARPEMGWTDTLGNQKTGFGQSGLCDPMQSGQIVNDLLSPVRTNTINRYSKSIRGCDEAVMDLFKNTVVIDEDGKAHQVPIIWASQERAVAVILQDNVRKDNSLVVDRIKLPMLAIYSSDFQFNQQRYTYHKAVDYMRDFRDDFKPGFTVKEQFNDRDTIFGVTRGIPIDIGYTLYAWTFYLEDMNQIIEQILLKFSPIAYIRVRGVSWEVGVKLNSIANNLDIEPGDKKQRVIKFQFSFTAETYIPQPIVRKKAVLKTDIGIYNDIDPTKITDVLGRLDEAIKDFR